MRSKQIDKLTIYNYLKEHKTLSKRAICDFFYSLSGESKIEPETVSRRLRELREETEQAEKLNMEIERKVYLVDKVDMIYSVIGLEKEAPAHKFNEAGEGMFNL